MNNTCQISPNNLKTILDYIPEIIVLIGTLLGTVLGWLLHYISSNFGKLDVNIEEYLDKKSRNNEYAYNLRLFIYNHSIKPNYIKDINIEYYKEKKVILKSYPREQKQETGFRNILDKKKPEVILIRSFEPIIVNLCDIIHEENYSKLYETTKIVFSYKDKKQKKMEINLNEYFSINRVMDYNEGEMFPK